MSEARIANLISSGKRIALSTDLWATTRLEYSDECSRHCDFKVIRHATYDKANLRDPEWSASITCNGRPFNHKASRGTDVNSAAIMALNRAFLRCGARPAGCQVTAFSTAS